ncbi:hypothetical protein [Ectobacillus ponti]|uniref:Uncharacterized protein n=1 Tax=Ectobacillus ponti TaxID=2961894 RepID=A0AA41X676_9BACI|nr:hypothetical protein [Ectobacillus ponti]MCP8967384.1 hypothetical protein [Ectobacillus ponti]
MVKQSLLVREVIDRISKSHILSVYEKFIKKDLESIILSLYALHYQDHDVKEILRLLKKDSFNRTKRRWLQNAVKDYEAKNKKKGKELLGEYLLLRSYFERNGAELFRQQFDGALSPEEVIYKRIQFLTGWSNDESAYLSEYLYLQQKTKTQIEKAVQIDITLIIGTVLTDTTLQSPEDIIIESPFSTVENPFFANTRGKVTLADPLLKREGKEYFLSSYNAGEGANYELLVEKEYAEGNGNKVSDLDRLDYKIFLEVMSKRDELFATQKIINIKIGDVVKNLYKTDSARNYKTVEERIVKMKHYSMTKTEGSKRTSYGIFDFVEVTTNPNGTRVAEIHVNEVIYRDYLQRQTIRMYRNKVEKLSLDSSYHLLFVMQKERLICYETKSPYTVSRDYLYFSTKIRFRKRRKQENLQEIEEALDELVKQNIVVQSYRRVGQVFQITFIPIDEEEVRNLLAGDYEYMPLASYKHIE